MRAAKLGALAVVLALVGCGTVDATGVDGGGAGGSLGLAGAMGAEPDGAMAAGGAGGAGGGAGALGAGGAGAMGGTAQVSGAAGGGGQGGAAGADAAPACNQTGLHRIISVSVSACGGLVHVLPDGSRLGCADCQTDSTMAAAGCVVPASAAGPRAWCSCAGCVAP